MQVYVRLKQLVRRRDVLAPIPYEIPDGISSLRQLLTAVAQQEARRYNEKESEAQLIAFLTPEEIDTQASAGKVGFGSVYSQRKADPEAAAKNALRCWEDGLVRVFINDNEVTEADRLLTMEENSVLTFIRLTFLSGRMW